MRRTRKLLAIILCAVFLLGVLSGCGSQQQSSEPTVTEKTIVDMAGVEVKVPGEVKTVVNLWPSSNELMLCLGAGDYLVGTMDFVKQLPWVNAVYPKIKDVPAMEVNAEELLEVDPDLIITANADDAAMLREAGLCAVTLMFNDYDSMKKATHILGDILGGEHKEKSNDLVDYIDSNIAKVENALKDLKDEDKPVVYYIQGQRNQGLYSTTGGGTIMEQWVTYGGGKFATADIGKGMQLKDVTPEQILTIDPDIVVIGGPAQHELYEEIYAASEWKDIKAVKNEKVYIIPNGCFPWDRFGGESAMQVLWAAKTFHPDLVDVDMVTEVKDFYKKFVGYDMTDEEATNMLNGKGPKGE